MGVLIIAGIYLWDIFKQKKSRYSRREGYKNTSYAANTSTESEHNTGINKLVIKPKSPEIDLTGLLLSAKNTWIEQSDDINLTPSQHAVQEADEPVTEILKLLIKAPDGRQFSGKEILNAAENTGLKFGDMNIFHYYSEQSDQAVFSLVNMYEPGYFKLDKMDSHHTKGLILFMRLPTSINNVKAFDLMYETARNIADMLEANIYSPAHLPLDEKSLFMARSTANKFS